MRRQRRVQALFLNGGMLVLALLFLLPIVWMIVAATKANYQILSVPPSLAPGTNLAANWRELSDDLPFLRNVFNSVAIASIFTLFATLISAMGGYAFAKFSFRGRAALFMVVVAALTIPFEVRAIPQYLLIARDLRLANTWIAVILPWLAYPLGIFFMRQNTLGTLVGLTRVSWGGIMVGTAIATVPFLVLFLFLQRSFVAGITAGAVKD
ncbi:MAG: carbohydrate ABC transporter permease [Deinococcales bacterium]